MATVTRKNIANTVRAVGTVEASSTVEVRSQVTGALLTVEFKEGQDVRAGDLLFTLDPRPFELAVKQAEAQLAKDSGQSKTAEAQRTRATELLDRGVISRSDFDTISATANSIQGTINADNVQIENARLQLQYTRIRAPIDGRTGAFLVHPGALIRANDTSPMVVINRISPVLVGFALPARLLPRLRAEFTRGALEATANQAGSDEAPSTGKVTFIDNAIDQSTDTIRLKATFPNRDHGLWPGQFVDVSLQVSVDEQAIVVPSTAVQPGQQGTYVWVVKDGKTAVVQPVTVTRTEGDQSIVATGLSGGETVVTDGQLRLTPNSTVSIKKPEQDAARDGSKAAGQ
ncbi:MAG TPA: efflux RND transporter periplasmic adaptor subunit [Vicinamibacterales bacterium]|nr:efflux RND transporter periplasmic adaptor subunit [Vicinamibacterales bacterium]